MVIFGLSKSPYYTAQSLYYLGLLQLSTLALNFPRYVSLPTRPYLICHSRTLKLLRSIHALQLLRWLVAVISARKITFLSIGYWSEICPTLICWRWGVHVLCFHRLLSTTPYYDCRYKCGNCYNGNSNANCYRGRLTALLGIFGNWG